MHNRKGSKVKAHQRNGTWVQEHNRSATIVNSSKKNIGDVLNEKYYWFYQNNLTFNSICWECNEPVVFYRNENGGCALFDDLGDPWPIHKCWLEKKIPTNDAINNVVAKAAEQLINSDSINFDCINTPIHGETDCFLIGFNQSKRLVVNLLRQKSSTSHYRSVVYKSKQGFIEVIIPESELSTLLKHPRIFIEFINFERNGVVVHAIDKAYLPVNKDNLFLSKNSELVNSIKSKWITVKSYFFISVLNTQNIEAKKQSKFQIYNDIENFLKTLATSLPKSNNLSKDRALNILCLNIFECHLHQIESDLLDNCYNEVHLFEHVILTNLRKLKINEQGVAFFKKNILNIVNLIKTLDNCCSLTFN